MRSDAESIVESVLSESEAEARRREAHAFDLASGEAGHPIVLFNAGGFGVRLLAGLRSLGVEPAAFADNNPALWGCKRDGVAVLSPEAAASSLGREAAFVVATWNPQNPGGCGRIIEQLRRLRCRYVLPFTWLFWKLHSVFLPHYLWDLPHKLLRQADEIRRAWEVLDDRLSRSLFAQHLRLRATGELVQFPQPDAGPQYFPEGLYRLLENECFVDCGAYNGDTIRSFLAQTGGKFGRMMAFEPDPENFAALQSYLSAEPRLDGRATAYRAALGARRGRLQFAALATSSSSVSQSGGCEVDCVTLDEVLAAERPTLVKMDIEGGERDALMGGSEILRKHAPLVAVCIYHCQSDLWKLPYMLHELQPEHRILLRQHGVDGWELVCYSVPKGRLM